MNNFRSRLLWNSEIRPIKSRGSFQICW